MPKAKLLSFRDLPIFIITTKPYTDLTERRRKAMERLMHGLKVKNWQFIESLYVPKEPIFGCAFGHTLAVEKALAAKHSAFIILEDDVTLLDLDDHLHYYVPEDADAFYLGMSVGGTSFISNENEHHWGGVYYKESIAGTVRIYNMLSTHAVVVLNDKFARNYLRCATEACSRGLPVDTMLALTHRHYNVYGLMEPAFYQSDILGGQAKYTDRFYGIEIQSEEELPDYRLTSCSARSFALDMAAYLK
jgi:hypothetical protein